MSLLFTPLAIRDLVIRNRIFLSPMCQYSSPDGVPSDWHLVHLGSRAVGGAGLVIVEATAISADGRISPYDLGLWSDEQVSAFSRITRFIRDQGSVPAIQLAHAGRKAATDAPWQGGRPLSAEKGGWQGVAPSPLPFAKGFAIPHQLSEPEIEQTVASYAAAAKRAETAGFQVIEIHMAHGYLLHSFLSPIANRREDKFGGSLDNRMRLPLRVAKAVRENWPAHSPVFVRISATDWVEGGWDLTQSITLCQRLRELGVDLVDVSSGGLTADAKIPAAPGYQTPFAEAIRRETNLLTATVGLITEPAQAEHILQTGQADAIALGRELLRDPYWPLHAARTLGDEFQWPVQYERARI